jgi:hypothetical protein
MRDPQMGELDLYTTQSSRSSFTAKVGTEGATEKFLFWNVFKEL